MTPSSTNATPIDMTKEKDWPVYLGMLDWDKTSIVFTKRSLIEFLKYTGTTVDPSFNNISKLPRYAKFSRATEDVPTPTMVVNNSETPVLAPPSTLTESKPSRRVRDVPGGPHSDIFSNLDGVDALSTAPPKEAIQTTSTADMETFTTNDSSTSFKPSRRVRANPGGASSMASLWDPIEDEEFKPTRRVREVPGGRDNLSGIL